MRKAPRNTTSYLMIEITTSVMETVNTSDYLDIDTSLNELDFVNTSPYLSLEIKEHYEGSLIYHILLDFVDIFGGIN